MIVQHNLNRIDDALSDMTNVLLILPTLIKQLPVYPHDDGNLWSVGESIENTMTVLVDILEEDDNE
jgi:hypothetical protein